MDPKQEIFDILYQFNGLEFVLDVGHGGGGMPVFKTYPLRWDGIDLKDGIDWYDFEPMDYDIIIANDLFPNVDQRLELFLDKYLPHCKEMRLSLTYFDEPKWYRAKRVDGDEILTMQAWSRDDLVRVLKGLSMTRSIVVFNPDAFPNKRRVCLVWLKGGLA